MFILLKCIEKRPSKWYYIGMLEVIKHGNFKQKSFS